MARAGYTVTVKGGEKLDQLIRRVRRARSKQPGIEVGIFKSARYQDGTPVAMVGAIHNSGAPNANIPPRPWLTNALPKIQKAVRQLVRDHVDPRNPELPKAVANLIGRVAQSILQESITELSQPPLAESTKIMKRAAGKKEPFNVLIDTGYLRQSITFEVRT